MTRRGPARRGLFRGRRWQGIAWALIPGGNGAMVLYLAPSLALHGIIAYLAMLTTLIGIESLKRRGVLST